MAVLIGLAFALLVIHGAIMRTSACVVCRTFAQLLWIPCDFRLPLVHAYVPSHSSVRLEIVPLYSGAHVIAAVGDVRDAAALEGAQIACDMESFERVTPALWRGNLVVTEMALFRVENARSSPKLVCQVETGDEPLSVVVLKRTDI